MDVGLSELERPAWFEYPRLNWNPSSVVILVFGIFGSLLAFLKGDGPLHLVLIPAMIQHVLG